MPVIPSCDAMHHTNQHKSSSKELPKKVRHIFGRPNDEQGYCIISERTAIDLHAKGWEDLCQCWQLISI
jgi:hypothetical protein